MGEVMYLLGAPDPEMARIERALDACAIPHEYARAGGRRVTPETAYRADAIRVPVGTRVLVQVECAPAVRPRGLAVRVIDHHRPGDPGYESTPPWYMSASSLGQVLARMARDDMAPAALLAVGVVVPPPVDTREAWYAGGRWYAPSGDTRLCAAADHCLSAAYLGRCPGVDPATLYEWRLAERAAFQRRPVGELLADGVAALAALAAAPRVVIAVEAVADLTAPGQPGTVPELPDAVGLARVGALYRMVKHGRPKIGLLGAGAEAISAWQAEQRALGRETWGVPARGYAGAWE